MAPMRTQARTGEDDARLSAGQVPWLSEDGYHETNEEDVKELGNVSDDGQGDKILLIERQRARIYKI